MQPAASLATTQMMTKYQSILLVAYYVVLSSVHMIGTVMGQDSIATSTEDASIISTDDDNHQQHQLAPFLIRLHLIRHGETYANVQNLVLGQGDSPLTEDGVAIARLAATSDMINGKGLQYYRHYCSDLGRAHRTARIILGLERDDGDGNSNIDDVPEEDNSINLIVDSRLRELAKGAREGYLKSHSYEEALAKRRVEAAAGVTTSSSSDTEIDIPKLESLDDAYERVKNWIDSIIEDVSKDYYATKNIKHHNDQGDISTSNENGEDDSIASLDAEVDPKVYGIFALSHSALIRTVIHKMVDHELPSDYATTKEGSLRIPNLSRSIIDIRPFVTTSKYSRPRWTPSLYRLTDVSHLNGATTGSSGPPYL